MVQLCLERSVKILVLIKAALTHARLELKVLLLGLVKRDEISGIAGRKADKL